MSKRCKAIREDGKRCKFHGKLWGYCAIHFKVMLKKGKIIIEDE